MVTFVSKMGSGSTATTGFDLCFFGLKPLLPLVTKRAFRIVVELTGLDEASDDIDYFCEEFCEAWDDSAPLAWLTPCRLESRSAGPLALGVNSVFGSTMGRAYTGNSRFCWEGARCTVFYRYCSIYLWSDKLWLYMPLFKNASVLDDRRLIEPSPVVGV